MRTWYTPSAGDDGTVIYKWVPLVTLRPDDLDIPKSLTSSRTNTVLDWDGNEVLPGPWYDPNVIRLSEPGFDDNTVLFASLISIGVFVFMMCAILCWCSFKKELL